MKLNISAKVLPLSIIGIILTGYVLGSSAINTQKSTLINIYNNDVKLVQKIYMNMEMNDIKMLKAAITDFSTNQEIKNIFLESNREKLLAATQDLYAKHKELGITHFYFHRTDGTNFLRVHTPATFDDKITRATLKKSMETNSWGTGIELGKTAFALRVVYPYFNVTTSSGTTSDGISNSTTNTIGYIEFGEEINHFNKLIKDQTGDEVVTVVDKAKIDAKGWAGLTEKNGVRNNYDDMKDFVAIDATNPALLDKANYCWNENTLKNTKEEGNIYGLFSRKGKTYSCGGFVLKDANDNKVGVVVAIKDVTSQQNALISGINKSIMLTAIIVVILSIIIMMAISMIIVRPLRKLTEAGNKIGGGEINTPLPKINSSDEIKDLSDTMETLVGAIKFLKKK